MGVFETFSKRQKKREKAGQLDVYQYDTLSDKFRRQVIHIWLGAIGPYIEPEYNGLLSSLSRQSPSNQLWYLIFDTLRREEGVFDLGQRGESPFVQCQQYLLAADTRSALDIIELSFKVIDRRVRYLSPDQLWNSKVTQSADDAILELNARFQEHSIGYQFEGGELIKVGSQYIHSSVVKPALTLLHDKSFRGAESEFLSAHEHYRKGRYKEAIVDALKAFESTIKAICDARKWHYSPSDSAKELIKIIFDEQLIPPMLQTQFAGLRSLLESGLPTVRNKTSGHGQGSIPVDVPEYFAAYALHLAASNIVFLVEAHKAKSK